MTLVRGRAWIVILGALSILGCDDESSPPISAPGAAVHGGTLVQAGPYPVEVVAHSSGQVYAYAPVSVADPASAQLTVDVATASGRRPVRLRYDRREGRYAAVVTRDTIVPGPVHVTYVVGGVSYVGFIAVIVIAPPIVVEVETDGRWRHHGKYKHRHW